MSGRERLAIRSAAAVDLSTANALCEGEKHGRRFYRARQYGSAMARNLLKAGHRVTVHNRSRGKAEALAADGAKVAESLAEAWRNPVVITMLAEDAAVEGVVFGDGGGLSTLGRDAVHISMSTISVALSDRLAEAHRKAGQVYIAAPVFGRPEAAAAAKLFIVAAGAEPAIARCQPLFDAIGQRTFIIGDKPSVGQSGQDQRQLPPRDGDRVSGRGVRAHPQRGSRPACLSRSPHQHAVLGPGVQDLRSAHRQ